MTTPITIVGCGPGSRDFLTSAARKAIARAGVLVGAERLLKPWRRRRVHRIRVGKDIPHVLNEMEALLAKRRRIAVLVTGDPGIFSLAQPVLKHFGRARCRVIPGVSSVQVAFARLGLDWSDARILSAHDRAPRTTPSALRRAAKIAILAGSPRAWPWLRQYLARMSRSHRIFLCEDLTLKSERVREMKPRALARLPVSSLSVILLIRNSPSAIS